MFNDFKYNKVNNRLQFNIKDIDVSIVNGIRRILISDIPILGFIGEGPELSIEMVQNKSPLNNEIMTNRISLIPIHFSEEETEGFNEEKDTYVCELNIENQEADILNVYSSDIIVYKDNIKLKAGDNNRLFPKNAITKESVLITRLKKDEKLHFKATVKKRTGKFHTCFSAVSGCTYYFDYIEDKSKDTIENQKNYHKNKDGYPKTLVFSFEVINSLSHRYLISKAIKVIMEKLNIIISALESQTQDKIESVKLVDNSCEFIFNSEDDTIGNILQSYIHDTYVKTGKNIFTGKKCMYVGYICPHPLQDIMTMKITLEEQTDIKIFKTFLGVVCDNLNEYLNNILNEWYKETLSLDNK